ncbi:hypothetical protein C8J45_11351 [Sphingomonas sp. PP-CE-3G-477]|uniref:hypothetical protein n=1 Tax=Sphingomonas sp. PP-CE-3G-477 TaxID=2135660 RepID=UPI000D3BCCC0|nr:hypothetical protein [Sphingomonas sp. PP-CE-3G-477]PTQ60100.1 hypothetical protein C8J45_11351 [Sphingomonas sp. PP-CE-3G-477]
MLTLFFIGYPVLIAAVALLVRRMRPDWRTIRIVAPTNLPLPIGTLVAAGSGSPASALPPRARSTRAAWRSPST